MEVSQNEGYLFRGPIKSFKKIPWYLAQSLHLDTKYVQKQIRQRDRMYPCQSPQESNIACRNHAKVLWPELRHVPSAHAEATFLGSRGN